MDKMKRYEDFKNESNETDNLTQEELEKLHNIPIGYTNGLTKGQAGNLIGDGWTVDVISHIFKYLK